MKASTENRQVVRLGCAAGDDDLCRVAMKFDRNRGEGRSYLVRDCSTGGMSYASRVRVIELFHRSHEADHMRVDSRGRVIVEIDDWRHVCRRRQKERSSLSLRDEVLQELTLNESLDWSPKAIG